MAHNSKKNSQIAFGNRLDIERRFSGEIRARGSAVADGWRGLERKTDMTVTVI